MSQAHTKSSDEHEPKGYCPKCGYRIDPGQCPECGIEVPQHKLAPIHPRLIKREKYFVILLFSVFAVLIGPLCIPIGWVVVDCMKEYLSRIHFDAEVWRNQSLEGGAIRIRMIDDLLASVDFMGMSRQEVIEMLGTTDRPELSTWELIYYLGPERGRSSKPFNEYLVLRFDDDDEVSECRVVTSLDL